MGKAGYDDAQGRIIADTGKALSCIKNRTLGICLFGFKFPMQNGLSRPEQPPEHIRQVAEVSLKPLKIDRIDLFYQHGVDPDVPIEDIAGAVKDLIRHSSRSSDGRPFRHHARLPNWSVICPGYAATFL
jgi:hypothetical protein